MAVIQDVRVEAEDRPPVLEYRAMRAMRNVMDYGGTLILMGRTIVGCSSELR